MKCVDQLSVVLSSYRTTISRSLKFSTENIKSEITITKGEATCSKSYLGTCSLPFHLHKFGKPIHQSINQSIKTRDAKESLGYPDRYLLYDGRPSTPVLCDAKQ